MLIHKHYAAIAFVVALFIYSQAKSSRAISRPVRQCTAPPVVREPTQQSWKLLLLGSRRARLFRGLRH